jgi:hypothetical protein
MGKTLTYNRPGVRPTFRVMDHAVDRFVQRFSRGRAPRNRAERDAVRADIARQLERVVYMHAKVKKWNGLTRTKVGDKPVLLFWNPQTELAFVSVAEGIALYSVVTIFKAYEPIMPHKQTELPRWHRGGGI